MQRKLAESATQYRVRAEHGDMDAQYHLGSAYYYGRGVPRDYAEAIRWFRKSAEQGIAKAQYALGYGYLYGQGVPQDLAEAIRWDRKAVDQGYPRAQCELASLYYQGKGVPRDFAESLRWYRKCADQGDTTGQRTVGYLYDHGEGVPQDSVEAARWYRKAAEQGDLAAEVYLGDAYRRGQGVPRNYVEVARWYLKIAGSVALQLRAPHGLDTLRRTLVDRRRPPGAGTALGTRLVVVLGVAVHCLCGMCTSPRVRFRLERVGARFRHRRLRHTIGNQCARGGVRSGAYYKEARCGPGPTADDTRGTNGQPGVARSRSCEPRRHSRLGPGCFVVSLI